MTVRLTEKAKLASMYEARLVRLLISGYHPPEAPGKEFHEDMNNLLGVAENLYTLSEHIARKNLREQSEDLDEVISIMRTASRDIRTLRMQLLEKCLKGEKVNIKWR